MLTFPHTSVGFQFTSNLNLLTLKGCGLHYINSHDYSWNNRTRKDQLCLIQYCVSGKGMLELNGITYSIQPKDAFIVDIPGENHYYLPDDSDEWEVLFLEFSKECLPLMHKIYHCNGPIIHFEEDTSLPDKFFDIFSKAIQNEISSFFENSKIAYSLWMDLISYVLSSNTSSLSKIDYAKKYIDQNYYMTALDLDFIASKIGISKYYMCKEFQKKFGISPGKYIKQVRINQACRILTTTTSYTMEEIAQMVGYANNNYFGKVFKSVKGITPAKFRQETTKYDLVRTVFDLTKNQ